MNYLISESKLNDAIYSYIDKMFDLKDIGATHPYEYDGFDNESENVNILTFYRGDYDGPWDSDFVFTWIGINYYDPQEDKEKRKHAPIVELHEDYCNVLNSYFGNLWHEPFKRWFKEKNDLSIKTISCGLTL